MKKFLDADFLLETEVAKRLYHDHAENLPIIDYHCHLSPAEIAENKKFSNINICIFSWGCNLYVGSRYIGFIALSLFEASKE